MGRRVNFSRDLGILVRPWWRRRPPVFERDIRLYVGWRGSGKSLSACFDGVRRLRRGEKVYANIELCDPVCGLMAGRIYTLPQLIGLKDATVVIDEAGVWCDSREWGSVPAKVRSDWVQSRHDGIGLCLTATNEARIDKVLREIVEHVVLCDKPSWVPRRLPIFRYFWTRIEDVEQIRRGAMSSPMLRWMPAVCFSAYSTEEKVEPGIVPDGSDSPLVREPAFYDGVLWRDWVTGAPVSETQQMLIDVGLELMRSAHGDGSAVVPEALCAVAEVDAGARPSDEAAGCEAPDASGSAA